MKMKLDPVSRRNFMFGALASGMASLVATNTHAEVSRQSTAGASTRGLQLHAVAFTGNYNDLNGIPTAEDIGNFFADTVEPGEAGPTDNQTLTQVAKGKEKVITPFKGTVSVPYFRVNEKGLIQEYGSRTLTFAG